MLDTALPLILQKFDTNSLLLIAVLWGVWKFAQSALGLFTTHADKVSGSLEKISEDCSELRRDLSVVVSRVESHENRIDRLETK